MIFHFLDIPQFIHLPTERHLGCFRVLTIMNKAVTNIYVHVFCIEHKFSIHLNKYQEAWSLGHMLKGMLSCEGNHWTAFESGCAALHSHQQWMWVPVVLQPCQCSGFRPLQQAYSGISLFNLHFPDDIWYEHLFRCSSFNPCSLVKYLFGYFCQGMFLKYE